MGVNVLRCFRWYNKRKGQSKMAKGRNLEGPVSELDSIHQNKAVAGGCHHGSSAYFSQKARVSFRHELDSPTCAINSTI
ncbi:uncharacterized protein C17orf114-like [Narcine bancroftii]|uniref:uncharacterized protein C17orf114-like n=1 Tax=Narcine bancroftii TaxID=1343680 RepID=UPI003831C4FB